MREGCHTSCKKYRAFTDRISFSIYLDEIQLTNQFRFRDKIKNQTKAKRTHKSIVSMQVTNASLQNQELHTDFHYDGWPNGNEDGLQLHASHKKP